MIIQSDMLLKQLIPHCQRIDNKLCSLSNTFFDKRASISTFNEKFKFSTSFIPTASSTLSFTVSFANNISNDDHHHDSMNFFAVIIDFRRSLIDVEKTHNREHRQKNDLCLYCGEDDHLFKNCSHKLKSQLRAISFVAFSSSVISISFSKTFDSENV